MEGYYGDRDPASGEESRRGMSDKGVQSVETVVDPSDASGRLANLFLYALVARRGGSIKISAKVWQKYVMLSEAKVHLRADRTGNVTAFILRKK